MESRLLPPVKTFINNAMLVHGNYYKYEKVTFDENTENIIIICPDHGEFVQKPNYHLRGYGCPLRHPIN